MGSATESTRCFTSSLPITPAYELVPLIACAAASTVTVSAIAVLVSPPLTIPAAGPSRPSPCRGHSEPPSAPALALGLPPLLPLRIGRCCRPSDPALRRRHQDR